MFKEKYINAFTDFGFKKLFGEELNKDILIDFLNELLKEEGLQIKNLTYLRNEHLGSLEMDRRAIFDLYCESETGEKFIVELQKAKQNFFKDRSIFYSTFPIREQAERGEWNFELKAVYTIGILDFIFEEDKAEKDKFYYKIKLKDTETNKVFYDKLTFIYLEMPKFNKEEAELQTHFDKWLYVLKNLHKLEQIPVKLKDRVFQKLFKSAEIAKFTSEMLEKYEDSLKYYRDIKNSLDTAKEEGLEEGIAKGKAVGLVEGKELGLAEGLSKGKELGLTEGRMKERAGMIVRMLEGGMSVKDIVKITGSSIEEIQGASN